jgi:NitT/TauT family transport system substrate-binding protein
MAGRKVRGVSGVIHVFFRKGRLLVLVITLLVLVSASCGGDEADESQQTGAADEGPTEQVEVTFFTDFQILGYHGFYFVPLEKGWYEEAGLDVTIKPGNGSADSLQKVLSGAGEIGFIDAGVMSKAIADEGAPVKMVAAIFQDPGVAIIAHDEVGIDDPKDLEGKSIGVIPETSQARLLPALFEVNDVDANAVEQVRLTFANLIPSFLSNRVDAIALFSTDIGFIEESSEGQEFDVLKYGDFGLDLYGNGLVIQNDYLESNPDAIRAFVEVTLRGINYTLDNPEEAAEIVAKHAPGQTAESLLTYIPPAEELVVTSDSQSNGLGTMTEERWEATEELMTTYGGQENEVSLDELYVDDFLPSSPVFPTE